MMIPLKLLAILILAAHDVYGKCESKWSSGDCVCNGQCGQGEGDCDKDSNCLDGLICKFDGWYGTDYCQAGPYTKNFGWTDWEDWSECSVECGGDGTQTRMRYCTPPENGGYPCPEDWDSETQGCNYGFCPVNGGWGEWSEWEYCPVTCGGAAHSRTRECDSPAPQYGGDDCPTMLGMKVDGSTNTETEECGIDPCPIDGGFSDWDEWGPCSAECGGGDQTRARRCDKPTPQYGGLDCDGDFTDCQRCNMDPCPSYGCPA